MYSIVINSSNAVQSNTNNNTFIYEFPGSVSLKNKSIAVSSISMYYSWFNISSTYNNNTFSYSWTVGTTTTTYNITIPDGNYNIVDLNKFLQYTMINNGTYLINSSGEYVYYAEFLLNPTRYAVQINTFLVPTSLPSGFTQPSNFVGYPTQTFNPIITVGNFLNIIIGYTGTFVSNNNVGNAYTPPSPSSSNYYVSKNSLGTLSYLSNTNPNVQPNSSIYLSMSNINNPYSQPSSIIYSISPTVAVGEVITEKPPNYTWVKMIDGTYNQLRFEFLGTDKRPLILHDTNLTIMLTIKDKEEIGIK